MKTMTLIKTIIEGMNAMTRLVAVAVIVSVSLVFKVEDYAVRVRNTCF